MVKTVMVDWRFLEGQNPLIAFKKSNYSIKAFIQARIGPESPNGIYQNINGAPLLFHVINMVKQSRQIDDVLVISPSKLEVPEGIINFVYDGNENDVLSRYFEAAKTHHCDYIVRFTANCPLLDYNLIDFVIAASINHDYGSNVLVPTFPDGMDIEVFSMKMLRYLHDNSKSQFDREHVTTLIRNNPYHQIASDMVSVQAYLDQSYIKLTVTNKDDLYKIQEIEKNFPTIIKGKPLQSLSYA